MAIQAGQIHHQRYKFERLIGQGAFGVTWQGQQLLLRRPVAIKVIDGSKLDEASLERIIRECQIGGQLRNAHIVNVSDAYREGDDLCLVMEFMAGGNLKDYLADHQPSLARGLGWGLDLVEALLAVHELGIIHRDVKPANILLTEDRQVKIADFGIAHLPGSHLTGTFQPGTPAYRSPEQEENRSVDAATDVYALSAVLFEIFSGEKFFRFKGITLAQWQLNLRQLLVQRYPEVPEVGLARLAELLAGGLATERTARSSLLQVRQALVEILAVLPEATTGHASGVKPGAARPGSPGDTAEQTPISRIGRYELQALIGRGGMGTVHKAYDPQIDRPVALKTVTIVDPSWRARFQQEVRISGRLNHPHIVTIYDVGEAGDIAYIVMELVEGQTLADLLPARLAWPATIQMLLPVCQALDYAHRQGVVHRDIKPANILLAADGRIKLSDFGIARMEAARQLTQTGAVVGTPLYMAPEQLAGQPVDERADIFGLGVILFELVTGKNPFAPDPSGSSSNWNIFMRLQAPDFKLLEGLAPLSLQNAIRRALAEERTNRFATAAELRETLAVCLAEASAADPSMTGSAAPAALPRVEVSSGVRLTPAERHLLAEAFSGHDRIYLEGELSGPASFTPALESSAALKRSGPRLLVALPVRSGRPLARVIVKLAAPELLRDEWKAYQEYVADILPLVTANVQGAPLLSPDRKLALLRYTFAGDLGERQTDNLASYYQNRTGMETAELLERNIFQVVAPSWWLNREADLFSLHREYEQLLPVQLVVEVSGETALAPVILKAGAAAPQDIRPLRSGRLVQIQGFRVKECRPEQGEMTLEATPPSGTGAGRLRLRVVGLSPEEARYQSGDLAPNFAGVIVATRSQLLARAAEIAFPAATLTQPLLSLGTSKFPNPLREVEQLLERPVAGMRSIIHGNLTLESILVEPETGLTWLINFVDTRLGHNLYDFIQLETQIVTQLLPRVVVEVKADLDDEVVAMIRSLHTSLPPVQSPHPLLQKPYDLLRTIRRLAGQCMLDPERWEEYYLGLMMMLLGTLPDLQDDPIAARLAFAWAAVAGELADRPLRAPVVPGAPPPGAKAGAARYIWLAAGLVGLLLLGLTGGIRSGIISFGLTPTAIVAAPPPTATPTLSPTLTPRPTATPVPSSTATATDAPTATPTPIPSSTPGPAEGVLLADLPVYDGPGTTYASVGNVSEGTEVTVMGSDRSGNWRNITWAEGSGWIDANFVTIEGTFNLPTIVPSPPATFTPTPTITPTPVPPTPTITATPLPTGSPTAGPNAPRELVSSTSGYQVLDHQAMAFRDPTSAVFSPHGTFVAATEGAKLYTIRRDGTDPHVWEEEDDRSRPVEGLVWSPTGALLAFVADLKRDCLPPACGRVGLIVYADPGRGPTYLTPPEGYGMRFPRWTQDGRLLVTIYKDDPANGTVYIYNASGRGQVAEGNYLLSSSTEGQAWFPWQPGRSWTVDPTQPVSYYSD